jgi:hypothetical protein
LCCLRLKGGNFPQKCVYGLPLQNGINFYRETANEESCKSGKDSCENGDVEGRSWVDLHARLRKNLHTYKQTNKTNA